MATRQAPKARAARRKVVLDQDDGRGIPMRPSSKPTLSWRKPAATAVEARQEAMVFAEPEAVAHRADNGAIAAISEVILNTIFLGGSRRVSRLPSLCRRRIDTIIDNGHSIVVGDANGIDKAVQKHIFDRGYEAVTVFCTGPSARNNVGGWRIEHVVPPKAARGFAFYAAKDREMAQAADYGLMIWDGQSPGTLLNVLRLLRAGKVAVLHDAQKDTVTNFRTLRDWKVFIADCDPGIVREIVARATTQEWSGAEPESDAVSA